jgi:glycosyltransferase involved in cell wall biosynthesis
MNESGTFLSLIIPCYNEEAIINECLDTIYSYLAEHFSPKHTWELLIINDGSKDKSGELAEEFAKNHDNIRVIHHFVNMNLGVAIKTGFANAKGEYMIVYDLDMSYSPEHIVRLIDTIQVEHADIVLASPYMKGGKTTGVPFIRKLMSICSNKYLAISSRKKISTFSGMVRAYRSSFIKRLSLKASTFEINTEIIFKAQILRARIVEIPAHLDWSFQNKFKKKRFSGIRIRSGIFDSMVSGFIFRPYMFLLIPGFVLLLLSFYIIIWIIINTYHIYPTIVVTDPIFIDDKFSIAISEVFKKSPHSFLVGGVTLIVALQFLGFGFLSLQSKRYFDETFYLGSKHLEQLNKQE